MVEDNVLIHPCGVVLDAKPAVAAVVHPRVDDRSAVLQMKRAVLRHPGAHRINGVLQQLPDKDTRIAVEIPTNQKLQNTILLHR